MKSSIDHPWGINPDSKNQIGENLFPIMPENRHDFWKALPVNNSVVHLRTGQENVNVNNFRFFYDNIYNVVGSEFFFLNLYESQKGCSSVTYLFFEKCDFICHAQHGKFAYTK